MSVTSTILITQFDTTDFSSSVREEVFDVSNEFGVRETIASFNSSSLQTHQPAVIQPAITSSPSNWETPEPVMDFWSDSPNNAPDLLYRHRFSWGRDEREVFLQPPKPGHLEIPSVTSPGIRWGKLDSTSGVLIYQKPFSLSSQVIPIEFHVKGNSTVTDAQFSLDMSFSAKELGQVTGEVTVQEKLFILNALPVPNSIKNPTTTDIYIRLGNLTFPIDPDTFVLHVDGVIQSSLTISEFFGGLGGFDITWLNPSSFDYGAQVDVRWEFSDTGTPPTPFLVTYPFYIVDDTVGPRISALIPGDLFEDVSVIPNLVFTVQDTESGVNIDSLILYVNNTKALEDNLTITELSDNTGYTIAYTALQNWRYGDLIPVSIFIKDKYKDTNETFYSYSFTTIESDAPQLIKLRPFACSVGVPTHTYLSTDIIDGGHGLDKDSITLTVGNVNRTGQMLLIPIIHRDK